MQTDVAVTIGFIESAGPPLQINWLEDLVPGEEVTYQEKHGDPLGVIIQLLVPDDLSPTVFSPSLSWGFTFEEDPILLIIVGGGKPVRYLIFSKNTQLPVDGFWNDSLNWNDLENWTD